MGFSAYHLRGVQLSLTAVRGGYFLGPIILSDGTPQLRNFTQPLWKPFCVCVFYFLFVSCYCCSYSPMKVFIGLLFLFVFIVDVFGLDIELMWEHDK